MSDVEEISRQPDTASSTASEETATHVVDVPHEREPGFAAGGAPFHAVRACSPRQGRARRAAALGTRRLGAGPMRRDPVDLLEEQARTRLPELGPIRYGRMLESPFTFFRGGASRWRPTSRTGRAPGCTPSSAATRTCPTSASSPRRPQARLQHQRLRRDPARAVRVGREAARGELRGRGQRSRLRRCEPPFGRDGGGREYREAMGALRERCGTSTSGTRASTSRHPASSSARRRRKQLKRLQRDVTKVRTKDSLRALRSCAGPSTASCGSSATRRS